MVQVYYRMSYKDYKKHCHRLPMCVGHSTDEKLTDDSTIILKVTGEDHTHHWLEQQPEVEVVNSPSAVVITAHPIMKKRG